MILGRASRSPLARRGVERLPMTRAVVDRFVAGEDDAAALAVVAELAAAGLAATVDLLGEDVHDAGDARRTRDGYLGLLAAAAEALPGRVPEVSVKLSALGQALPGTGEDLALEHAREICAAADAVGSMVTLDMEDHTTVDSTLALGSELRRQFPMTANVVQANLHRTADDLVDLGAEGARVRLVKGAYREPATVAFQRKDEVDRAYERDLRLLMRSRCRPMVATHDPAMVRLAVRLADEAGRGAEDWELQMLHGIRGDLQRELAGAGHTVRVYVPYGTDWYGYFMRRLAERPANVGFFLRALVRG